MIRELFWSLRKFARDERGSATVEFVILFPIFMVLFASSVEIGVMMMRKVMLERGLDVAARFLRVGNYPTFWGLTPEFDEVKQSICMNMIVVSSISDCQGRLNLELTPIDTATWTMPAFQAPCVNINNANGQLIVPAQNYSAGQRNVPMLMRACYIVLPFFGNYGMSTILPKDQSGRYRLLAVSAYVNEP